MEEIDFFFFYYYFSTENEGTINLSSIIDPSIEQTTLKILDWKDAKSNRFIILLRLVFSSSEARFLNILCTSQARAKHKLYFISSCLA